ncbi:MAG: hypothetical protein RBU29_12890 [bacterium]|jgi:hypothetical protein|nr:hypothetical protein [bacterium]
MRAILIAFTCFLVIGIILVVVTNDPVSTKVEVVAPKVVLSHMSVPIMKYDGDPERVLEFFPALQVPDAPAEAATQEIEPGTSMVAQPAQSESGFSSQGEDRARLLALIDDWVYVNFSQVGQTKQGRINQTKKNQVLTVYEGDQLESGIQVTLLTNAAATLRLGEAVYNLPLAVEPEFFKELRSTNNPRPLTPDEQKQALEFYMNRWGHKFKAMSEGYQPPPGMMMPQQMTPEQNQKGLEEYRKRYGQLNPHSPNDVKVPYPYPAQQRENFENYWKRFHPGEPMPDFEQLESYRNQFGPGNRIQSADELNAIQSSQTNQ